MINYGGGKKGEKEGLLIRIPFRAWNMCRGRFLAGSLVGAPSLVGARTTKEEVALESKPQTVRCGTMELGCYSNSLCAVGM